MVPNADDCGLAVIQYAVDTLLVEHSEWLVKFSHLICPHMAAAVVVVGHTKCGGVEAAWLTSREPVIPTDTPLQRWLVPLINLSKELGLNRLPIGDKEKALRILTEENARRQVRLCSEVIHGPVMTHIHRPITYSTSAQYRTRGTAAIRSLSMPGCFRWKLAHSWMSVDRFQSSPVLRCNSELNLLCGA
jgi:hypothetical protein